MDIAYLFRTKKTDMAMLSAAGRAMARVRSVFHNAVLNCQAFRRPAVAYCARNELLPGVFVRTPSAAIRALLQLPASPHTTQLNQDLFALLANRFRPGFFLEIGANDGYTLSNTVYLEEEFGWDGLLIEANPQYIDALKKRKAKSVTAAVVGKDGEHEFCSAGLYGGLVESLDRMHESKTQSARSITVSGKTLERILLECGAPDVIDFVSLDVEGAELSIVEQMCQMKRYRFRSGCIEYNARERDYRRMSELLQNAGYRVIWEGQTRHDLFFVDAKGSVFSG